MIYSYQNRNPKFLDTRNDCVIRSISGATGESWETVYAGLSKLALSMHHMIDYVDVFSRYLNAIGAVPVFQKKDDENVYIIDFVRKHTDGVYFLATYDHLVYSEDGVIRDTWDSTKELLVMAWKFDKAHYRPFFTNPVEEEVPWLFPKQGKESR